MYTILIADDNVQWRDQLRNKLEEDAQFSIVAETGSGATAVDLIDKHRPDMIVLDIILPVYDGLYILKYIREQMPEYRPCIYVVTAIHTISMLDLLNQYNVDFFSVRPIHVDVFMGNLTELLIHRNMQRTLTSTMREHGFVAGTSVEIGIDAEEAIANVLLRLGIPVHLMSTRQLRIALRLRLGDSAGQYDLAKNVYEAVAQHCQSNVPAVERNFRSAISKMVRANTPLFQEIFVNSLGKSSKVSNSEFLYVVATYIRVGLMEAHKA